MTLLSVSEAARALGVARSTIYDKVNDGELTRRPDKRLDSADLIRVFGEFSAPGDITDESTDATGAETVGAAGSARIEPASAVEGERPAGTADHTAWLQQLADQQQARIEALNERLDERDAQIERMQRDHTQQQNEQTQNLQNANLFWRDQLDRMMLMLPAPEPVVEAPPVPAEPKGWWEKWFGQ